MGTKLLLKPNILPHRKLSATEHYTSENILQLTDSAKKRKRETKQVMSSRKRLFSDGAIKPSTSEVSPRLQICRGV